jgi:hypothetical protein
MELTKENAVQKKNLVADRIAMFAKKSPCQDKTRENNQFQRDTTRVSSAEKVNILERISMFKKDSGNLSMSPSLVKPFVMETPVLSISERISILRQEQNASNDRSPKRHEILHSGDFTSITDRINQLVGEAEKNSLSAYSKSTVRLSKEINSPPSTKMNTSPIKFPMESEKESRNKLMVLFERLSKKDPSFTVLKFTNSTALTSKDSDFELFVNLLRDNPSIIDMELCNISMKDKHCFALAEVLKTCPNLIILNIETNMISGAGIEAIALMAEKHPSLKELRVDNQRMAVGIEAERAIANCLSQNTNIIRLSYTFRETFVFTYVNKYLQRNLDLIRQARLGKFLPVEPTPYPYPHSEQEGIQADAAYRTPEQRDRTAGTIFERDGEGLSVAERVVSLKRETRISGVQTNAPLPWSMHREKEKCSPLVTAEEGSEGSGSSAASIMVDALELGEVRLDEVEIAKDNLKQPLAEEEGSPSSSLMPTISSPYPPSVDADAVPMTPEIEPSIPQGPVSATIPEGDKSSTAAIDMPRDQCSDDGEEDNVVPEFREIPSPVEETDNAEDSFRDILSVKAESLAAPLEGLSPDGGGVSEQGPENGLLDQRTNDEVANGHQEDVST